MAYTVNKCNELCGFCRIMRPDDANVVGNVHGGIILKMIEEAGCIVCTRHCNTKNGVGQADYTQSKKQEKVFLYVFVIYKNNSSQDIFESLEL